MNKRDINTRILFLRNKLNPIKKEYRKIIEESLGINKDLKNLDDSIKQKLSDLRNKMLPYRKELVVLNRMLLSNEEKKERRINGIDFMMKFYDENNNKIKAEYGKLYLKLLDKIKPQIKKDKKIAEIYVYLDEKDFQYNIQEEYLDILEQKTEFSEFIKKIKELSGKIE
ncbi:hypothetical protein [Aquimarina macrocephali]|uniref:hypothetical protein n=1 Tax=Aquimarina macrocephali TaxID=666563 RepID=UPI000465BC2B|nr:hypothetical protein [Aquimarina macrocephali]